MSRTSEERNPSFVKLLFNDYSNKMMIPPKFVRLHRGTLTEKHILKPTHTQHSWCVGTKQIENHLYFEEGWKVFAEHHSLKYGDFLLFAYNPLVAEFNVVMFDKSCCSKDPLNTSSHEDEEVKVVRDSPPYSPEDEKKKGRSSCSRFTTTTRRRPGEAFEAASELVSRSKHPTHLIVIQPYYLRKGYLIVPCEFITGMNLVEGIMNVKLQYTGKEWDATWRRSARLSSRISRGWYSFARENSLNPGDVCVLELINREEGVIKVSIFK